MGEGHQLLILFRAVYGQKIKFGILGWPNTAHKVDGPLNLNPSENSSLLLRGSSRGLEVPSRGTFGMYWGYVGMRRCRAFGGAFYYFGVRNGAASS